MLTSEPQKNQVGSVNGCLAQLRGSLYDLWPFSLCRLREGRTSFICVLQLLRPFLCPCCSFKIKSKINIFCRHTLFECFCVIQPGKKIQIVRINLKCLISADLKSNPITKSLFFINKSSNKIQFSQSGKYALKMKLWHKFSHNNILAHLSQLFTSHTAAIRISGLSFMISARLFIHKHDNRITLFACISILPFHDIHQLIVLLVCFIIFLTCFACKRNYIFSEVKYFSEGQKNL